MTFPLSAALGLDAALSLATMLSLALLPAVWSDAAALAVLLIAHLSLALRLLRVARRCAVGVRRAMGRGVVVARLALVATSGAVLARGDSAPWVEGLLRGWGALVALSCVVAGYVWWRSPARRR